jgi:tetratricopeptide (TPR) repeat protein
MQRPLIVSAAAIVLAAISAGAAVPSLKSSAEVLEKIERAKDGSPDAPPSASDAVQLLRDTQKFRAEMTLLESTEAAARWFALFDRARALHLDESRSDFREFDVAIAKPVGVESVLASLPPPPAWVALNKQAMQRAANTPQDREALGLRFITELLVGNREAANATLGALEKMFAQLPPDEREIAKAAITEAQSRLTKVYGSVEEVAAAFERAIREPSQIAFGYVVAPDLVGMVGEKEATRLLTAAVTSRSVISVESGDESKRLARRLAMENIDKMRVAQWQLVNSIEARELYEAIEKRFDPSAAASQKGALVEEAAGARDYLKGMATNWYFLASVIEGRQQNAERALLSLSGGSDLYLPKNAVEALQRAGKDEALFRFLDVQLERRPELRAWDIYISEAAFTGHSKDSLALVEKVLARKDLPEFLVADLRIRRINALLGADRLSLASESYRRLLSKPPVRGEPTLELRYEAALRAAGVGRLTGQRALSDLALTFAIAAAPLRPRPDESRGSSTTQRSLWSELRRSGRSADVQSMVIAELTQGGDAKGFQALGGFVSPGDLSAMVELAGIWSEAGRHRDVVQLLADSTRWGVKDAGKLLGQVDSVDVPFGVIVARALSSTGNQAAARDVARATVSILPGKDPAYELLATLDPKPVEAFDQLFNLDEFEERPLIWKAILQLNAGSLADAETSVRRAIAIDPSDGDEGPNDRMRAYGVLADILRRKGDEQGATTYTSAVKAIRISEKTDQYYGAGLYERAFKGYREALEQFADAYCIQSRLAVQLNKQGRRAEALEHYRRAYELMPDSFGRVESHCFGCESVFQGEESQSLAERVFTDAIRKTPAKAQSYYLLAYLRQQQDRPAEAIQPLRQAVSLDPHYLNAWVHLYQAGEHTYVEPGELDIARLKLLELDPLQRHARYSTATVGDLAAFWRGAERANSMALIAKPRIDGVYPLRASAAAVEKAQSTLTPEIREQMLIIEDMQNMQFDSTIARPAPIALSNHEFLMSGSELMGFTNRNY